MVKIFFIMLVLKSILLCLQIVYPKTDDQRKRLNDAVRNILLFKNVAPVSFWWSEYGLFEINLSVCFVLMFLLYCLICLYMKKKGGGGRGVWWQNSLVQIWQKKRLL